MKISQIRSLVVAVALAISALSNTSHAQTEKCLKAKNLFENKTWEAIRYKYRPGFIEDNKAEFEKAVNAAAETLFNNCKAYNFSDEQTLLQGAIDFAAMPTKEVADELLKRLGLPESGSKAFHIDLNDIEKNGIWGGPNSFFRKPFGIKDQFPEFPWPPPKASSMENLPNSFFRKVKEEEVIRMADVDLKINEALQTCGYYERSYYAVPDGYALVTRLEQINDDGTPKPQEERWLTEVGSLRKFSVDDYIRALFTSNPGFFRIIVFIVTSHPFSQADVKIERTEAMAWLQSGSNRLPSEIAAQAFTQEHSCTALIYEFEKCRGEQVTSTIVPGRLPARIHLQQSALWNRLQ